MSDTLTIPPVHRPRLGSEGEPCPSCGALLASDQRYCLSCGTRRGGTRVPFPLQAPAAVAPPPPARPARREGPFAAYPPQLVGIVSGIVATAVLALGLLVGVLFAHKRDGGTPVVAASTPAATPAATAAAPATFTPDWPAGQEGYTIQLQALPKSGTTPAAVAAAKSAAAAKGVPDVGALDSDGFASLAPGTYVIYSGNHPDEASATSALASVTGSFPDAKVVHVSASAAPASTPAATPTATPTAVTKTSDDLKKQKQQTPEQAQKNTKNAPPTQSSGGAPPPKDNKKAGGGSKTTTFG
jgi:hypothetical protein